MKVYNQVPSITSTDGCRAGWLAIRIDDTGAWEYSLEPSVQSMWDRYARSDRILIDIPIGLIDSGTEYRPCDAAARKQLGSPRLNSVFFPPCRASVYAKDYREACRINSEKTGRKFSKQAWGIAPKIREVDEFLRSDPMKSSKLLEMHPEIIFWALNSFKPMQHSKKKKQGFNERRSLLNHLWEPADEIISHILENEPRNRVARDDILDALAGAIGILLPRRHLRTIPETIHTDTTGLPMVMNYWDIIDLKRMILGI